MKKQVLFISAIIVLVMLTTVVLTACSPAADPAKAKEALEKNGYTVVVDRNIQPAALTLVGIKGVDTVLEATYSKDDQSEFLCVLYFTSASAAKDAWDAAKKEAEDEKKQDKKDDSDWVVGKSGKLIWYGTKAAVKAAR